MQLTQVGKGGARYVSLYVEQLFSVQFAFWPGYGESPNFSYIGIMKKCCGHYQQAKQWNNNVRVQFIMIILYCHFC